LNKGQVFMTDMVASIAVFSFFLVTFGVIWNVSTDEVTSRENLKEFKGQYTFEILRSEGSPPNWNKTNITDPGIYQSGKLDRDKFQKLDDLTRSRLRQLLRSQGYRLQAEYLNETPLRSSGDRLLINSTEKIPANRSVRTYRTITLDQRTGKRVELSFYRWSS
jgi:hypothetical protein